MTRREELEELAQKYAIDYVDSELLDEGERKLLSLLLQVEREAWEKAACKLMGWREEDPPLGKPEA